MKLTTGQGVIISAFTGVLCCDFGALHAAVEEKFGRPVWTHEFGSEAFAKEVKEAFRDDFIGILPEVAQHEPQA